MFTFETADQKEVRRFRIAQFNGRTATAYINGSTVTGHRSLRAGVQIERSDALEHHPIPAEPKVTLGALRPAPRFSAFAEDLY